MLFLSTLSLRRATYRSARHTTRYQHFYPRSPCGERPLCHNQCSYLAGHFYPRSPCGERLPNSGTFRSTHNFYPRSPCGERPSGTNSCSICSSISIHALLAESDCVKRFHAADISYFYPRSPCGERRICQGNKLQDVRFLSTLSLRRATSSVNTADKEARISIHALLAESDRLFFIVFDLFRNISIHALLAESDYLLLTSIVYHTNISIHALLAESDLFRQNYECFKWIFLSTLSLRRATHPIGVLVRVVKISIHALLAESDSKSAQNSGALLRI